MSLLMTGCRPTGVGMHIGQYFSAFKPFVELRRDVDRAVFIVSDLHMLTTEFAPQFTRHLAAISRRVVAEMIGFGADPADTTYYLQSSVGWSSRIYSILQSLVERAKLERHFSIAEMAGHAERRDLNAGLDASGIHPPSLGLLGYPVLESSDVLSIGPTHVTVGENNISHFKDLEIIVESLRANWGVDVHAPEVITARPNLMGLDGSTKMSKSLGNAIMFSDENDDIVAKVKGMALHAPDGRVIALEYLGALGTEEDLVRELEDEITASGKLTDRVAKELTDRLIALVEPVNTTAKEALRGDTVVEILRRGGEFADEFGERAYRELARGIGLLRL